MRERKLGPVSHGDRFEIGGGDGDQSYFSGCLNLRLIEAEWFPGSVPPFGSALLFGKSKADRIPEEYLAAVGKGGGLEEKLVTLGYSTVIFVPNSESHSHLQ